MNLVNPKSEKGGVIQRTYIQHWWRRSFVQPQKTSLNLAARKFIVYSLENADLHYWKTEIIRGGLWWCSLVPRLLFAGWAQRMRFRNETVGGGTSGAIFGFGRSLYGNP